MSTKVYVAPYVRGPQIESETTPTATVRTGNRCSQFLRHSIAGLAPHRLLESSGILLSIEVVAAATLVGAIGAWLVGSRGESIAIVLGIDALLGCALLVGTLIETARSFCRGHAVAVEPKIVKHWAYRVVNVGQVNQAAVSGNGVSQATAAGICDRLELEAVEPATLREGDVYFVEADQTVHADGTVLDGMAMIDESAVTGQSAPLARSADGEPAVMRDSRVITGQILVRVAARRGHPLDWIHAPPIGDASRPVPVLSHAGIASDGR